MKAFLSSACLIFFLAAAWSCGEAVRETDPVSSVTGARTRVVWAQDQARGSPDTYCRGTRLKLMGYDSHDGKGERTILKKTGNYFRPILTSDGKRVVFTDRTRLRVCVVDFDGSGYREIVRGIAADTWYDRKTGTEWVYAGEIPEEDEKGEKIRQFSGKFFNRILRYPLDGPGEGEVVWDRTQTTIDNFQVSRDGTRAVAGFPWPQSGLAVLPNKSWKKLRDGCWQSLSPDNSYVCSTFDGPHKGIFIHDTVNAKSWKVDFDEAPGIGIHPVYHPRWTNHPRFFMMTGPYKAKGKNNPVLNGGEGVEIYLGRFNPDFTEMEQWVKVSNNRKGDFYPDAWIEGAEDFHGLEEKVEMETARLKKVYDFPDADAPEYVKKFKNWPGDPAGLVYVWEDNLASNQVEIGGKLIRSCRGTLHEKARFGRFYDLDMDGGYFRPEDADSDLLEACKKSDELGIEATITPAIINKKRPAYIISFSCPGDAPSAGSPGFILEQIKDRLVFHLNREGGGENDPITLCRLAARKAQHVIVSYASGDLNCYLDGAKVFESREVKGGFSRWGANRLIFGSDWDGRFDWAGGLEGIAIYSRALSEKEAAGKFLLYARRFKERKPVQQCSVLAKLVEQTPLPSVDSLDPYVRGLVVYRYALQKVLAGKLEAKEILVAHWAVLDRQIVPETAEKRAGNIYELHLEKFKDHPQLGSELQLNTIENISLPMYYEVGKIAGRAQTTKISSPERKQE